MPRPNTPEIYALIGASATGKTTLFRSLRSCDPPNVAFAPEAARLYYEQHLVSKKDRPSYENQIQIQAKFLEILQAAIAEEKDTIITDCSPLSSVYYAMLGDDQEKVAKLTNNIREYLPLYTLFLLLNPADIDYQYDPNDPVRQETNEERLQVHQNILSVLESLALPFLLISGSVEERVAKITQLIR